MFGCSLFTWWKLLQDKLTSAVDDATDLRSRFAEATKKFESYVEHITKLSDEREVVAVELQVENNELKEKIEQLTLQLACQLSADAHRNTHSLHFTGHYCRWTSVSLYQNVSIRYFIGAMDDGSGDDNWSCKMCKTPVKSPLKTNVQLFTCWMPFLNPDEHCQSMEIQYYYYYRVPRAICCQPVDGSLICFM